MNSSGKGKLLADFTLWVLTLVLMAPLGSVSVMAQATTGALRGTVMDPNGGIISGASVRAKNQATGVETAPTTTTGEGVYEFPSLQPGTYTVTVEDANFKRSINTGFEVKVGIVNALDIRLQPGNIAETVTVTATEEVIQRDQAQISSSFETRRVEELPSNAAGSGIDTLALLAPGVVVNTGAGTNTNGTALSVNGNRGRSNNFQIDGSDNNDLSVAGPSYFVDNQDAVQEFQIITNNFSAQYGRNLGAVVNIVTKGGTNKVHGSAFEFHRDQKHLDSLNNKERLSVVASDPSTQSPPKFLSNVFGGTVGGPIKKDKAFFFGSYQGIRQRQESLLQSASLGILASEFPRLSAAFPGNPVVNLITTQSAFALPFGNPVPRADFTGPVTVGCVGTARGATRRAIVPCGTPGAQGPFKIGGPFDVVGLGPTFSETLFQAAFIQRLVPLPYNERQFTLRGDFKINDKNNFYARYLDQRSNSINALANTNGFTGDIPAASKNLGGTYTRQISNRVVNELRLTYEKLSVDFGGGCSGLGCIPSPSAIAAAPADVNFGGVSGFVANRNSSLRFIGPNNAGGLPQGRTSTLYQFADNLTFTRGRHSMIAGFEFKHSSASVPFLPSFGGSFTFNSGLRVVNNAPSSFTLAVGNPVVTYKENDQYYFFQDDWKIRENLTLNLGIRYEYTGQPINVLHDMTVARESNAATALFNPNQPLDQRVVPFIPTDKHEFAPRVGFAYSPRFGSGMLKKLFGESATVIRGGFAIAYDPAFYNILLNVANASPVSALLAIPSGSLPSSNSPIPLPNDLSGNNVRQVASAAGLLPVGKLNPLLLSQVPVSPNFHAPYSEQFSFGIQRQVNKNNVMEVRYVGTHGVGLFQTVYRNPVIKALAQGLPSQDVPLNDGTTTTVTFPAFPQFLPTGAVPAVCPSIPGSLNNDRVCNGRLIAGRGAITSRENTAQSIYHSMQARYNGRFIRNSLSIGASYTFSKTIDNSSEIFAFSENSSLAQNPFNINRGERGLSDLDRPHAFTTNFLYDVPYFKSQHGILGHLLGGFQLNGAYVIESGRAYSAVQNFNSIFLGVGGSYLTTTGAENLRAFIGNPNVDQRLVAISQVDAFLIGFVGAIDNPNGFYSLNQLNTTGNAVSVTPNDVRFIFNGPGAARIFGNPFGTSPRNNLRGPKLNQFNLGVFKNTRIRENVTLQFRLEAFNVLNRPNPGFGNLAAGDLPTNFVENAGQPGGAFADNTDITLARRSVQFGLRLIF